LLPANLLSCELRGSTAIPRFLGDADRPWVRGLIDECERFTGRPVRELEARLRDPAPGAPDAKRRLVAHLLLGMARSRVESPLPPREARAALFTASAREPADTRDAVIARCAGELGVSPTALLASLFADLPSERVAFSPPSLDPGDVVLRANLALAQGLLARAYSVKVVLEGNARAVARHAALRGLICSVTRDAGDDLARVELSGPFALFRKTLLYGRALGGIVPVLAWTRRFELEATCDIRGRRAVVTLATGDPIFPSSEPRRFDSRLEERFARDFARLARDWALIREPEPIDAGGHLFFPDFAVHPRFDPSRRWYVEIIGFWTPEYLANKLERLRRARVSNLVLCVDADRNVGDGDIPPNAALVRYRRRIDAAEVREIVTGHRHQLACPGP
jgi:predicted nuclease of restriction endonuclease-like RecB superfamily